jgi:hypothetical protein
LGWLIFFLPGWAFYRPNFDWDTDLVALSAPIENANSANYCDCDPLPELMLHFHNISPIFGYSFGGPILFKFMKIIFQIFFLAWLSAPE